MTTDPTARVRGMYATAVTELLLDAGITVVDPSPTIATRFDADFPETRADVSIRATEDRQGLRIDGPPDAVDRIGSPISRIAVDTFRWQADHPVTAVYAGRVTETSHAGATVALGHGRGFLPHSRTTRDVELDEAVAVQVIDPEPPWSPGRRPVVSMIPQVEGTYLTLVADEDEAPISAPTRELHGLVDLLAPELPDGWGIEVSPAAADQSLDVLEADLDLATERAERVDRPLRAATDATGPPARMTTVVATTWCRVGRLGRFELDERRARVTPTFDGHHRIKAAGEEAGRAVDFIERLGATEVGFDADAVLDTFGPTVGDRVQLEHGKPTGESIVLGRGAVTDRPRAGAIAVRRELGAGGTLDGFDAPKEAGDVAETTFVEGAWWYPTVYRDESGTRKGTYVNVGTPVELYPERVRYVDLYVDVVKDAAGEVRVLDEDELAAAVEEGTVSAPLADRARDTARDLVEAM